MTITEWITHDEGNRLKLYKDMIGKLTIGIGHNIEDLGITLATSQFIFAEDLSRVNADLSRCSWFIIQPPGVRDALTNMCFNLGIGKLLQFRNMIAALKAKDYAKAAQQALNSKWATQVPSRAYAIANVIRKGL